jgi:15-cis-phytoene synthase
VRIDPALVASYRYCDAMARREARNFYCAFRLLPHDRRQAMSALYAFLRQTDDLADQKGTVPEKSSALEGWRTALDAAFEGQPTDWPGFPALADTVSRWAIPHEYLHAAIDGVSMDVQPRGYADFAELADYCYHVASVVGLCCIHIWGYRSEGGKAERLAAGCGIALQLTNILRDVREDARNGRIYLPRDEMIRFGVEPGDLDASQTSPRVKELLAFEARRAYEYYDQARELVPLVAPIGRPVLLTITGIYRSLLNEIAARDFEVLSTRVTIPGWRKAAIALRALPGRYLGRATAKTATSLI